MTPTLEMHATPHNLLHEEQRSKQATGRFHHGWSTTERDGHDSCVSARALVSLSALDAQAQAAAGTGLEWTGDGGALDLALDTRSSTTPPPLLQFCLNIPSSSELTPWYAPEASGTMATHVTCERSTASPRVIRLTLMSSVVV
mmetsp:Transcript_10744/g.33959  ORF Transcript_10744/g.33959 Transcript_10744/m.33959 type:complete len:143 (-) Transcript_10744:491-919(-)|eukprot:CAMPEP_0185341938 /NCGR_PEP_ID=MMETSP1363-20130426/98876_1 /TAXON_ID=38817 /ORGANISM="Gephyrocapsa oceanica, Strain RCC1303" /LENGTH=142 /DNA_ID=CAMNT_0027941165 /DNA_START=637 /DNA_END=1065 /DNA_ORIENTATION=+